MIIEFDELNLAETRGFEPLDDITIIGYLVGSCFKPDSAMFPNWSTERILKPHLQLGRLSH